MKRGKNRNDRTFGFGRGAAKAVNVARLSNGMISIVAIVMWVRGLNVCVHMPTRGGGSTTSTAASKSPPAAVSSAPPQALVLVRHRQAAAAAMDSLPVFPLRRRGIYIEFSMTVRGRRLGGLSRRRRRRCRLSVPYRRLAAALPSP